MSMRTSEGGNNAEAVSVWLLGGFRIFVGSRSIGEDVWRLRKARAIVKLLALAPGHRLHRERVLDILWPDLGREAAANNLRQALHVARRVFDPNPGVGTRYLDSRGEMLALCPESPLWVDVDGFEEIAEGIRALFSGGKLPEEMADEIRAAYQNLSEDAVGGTPVAARSSATAEDLPGMSFGSGSGCHLVEKAEAELEGSDPTNVMPARLR